MATVNERCEEDLTIPLREKKAISEEEARHLLAAGPFDSVGSARGRQHLLDVKTCINSALINGNVGQDEVTITSYGHSHFGGGRHFQLWYVSRDPALLFPGGCLRLPCQGTVGTCTHTRRISIIRFPRFFAWKCRGPPHALLKLPPEARGVNPHNTTNVTRWKGT